jgi:hypothetical protein
MVDFVDFEKPRTFCYFCSWNRNARKVCIVKSEGRSQVVSPIHGWDDNIKTDVKETGWDNMN